ncbi:MAG: glycolate oxidase subunit GlcF [Rhizobiales bacterium]|nr:glycolate oxidase subunit GlcF [Hyphomicrobiales bacterium]MBI3672347.1 glycolate oxidase subunit GlcF [Hyphomicrobiales bacterium]
MQTNFTAAQLQEPRNVLANGILRKCVHCGFCTATCPTYVLLGDELDSPRGRIYLIKNMLEKGEPATAETVKHLDRCLSCLSCMTTCPSGVHYMHLVDEARAHVEETYRRPFLDRLLRTVLATVMPRPRLFRLALIAARLVRPLGPIASAIGFKQGEALLDLVPRKLAAPEPFGTPGTYAAQGDRRGRVALLMGCVQSVLDPGINGAAIRLITRLGYEVVVSGEEACCGSLTHHMGREADALARARRSIDQWTKAEVDAVVITASGCGTTIKDYGHMLRLDPAYAEKAKVISAMAKDVTEFLDSLDLPPATKRLRLAYHSACSMQHGQNITSLPQKLLARAGFEVVEVPEGHLCCGSAGIYNILQPEIAGRLKARKIANIETTRPQAVATGNIGCITQLSPGLGVPVLHTVELLDWAYGGKLPAQLTSMSGLQP